MAIEEASIDRVWRIILSVIVCGLSFSGLNLGNMKEFERCVADLVLAVA